MGLRPTRGNENPRRPREKPALSLPKGGDPRRVDSRFRGNDERGLIFRRARGWLPCVLNPAFTTSTPSSAEEGRVNS
jgi:hypothetical protein